MTLAATCQSLGISRRTLARDALIGEGTVSRILAGHWPKRDTAAIRARVGDVLRAHGASNAQLRAAVGHAAKEKTPDASTPEVLDSSPEVNQNPTEKEEPRLLTHFEAARELKDLGVAMNEERVSQLRAWHPEGVPEDQLATLRHRLTVRAGLRVVGGVAANE